MVEEFDIDISPQKGGVRGIKQTFLQETELYQVRENPKGLTKEGIEETIRMWSTGSSNKHVVLKYQMMLKHCKNIQPSGLHDGFVIWARNPSSGEPTWLGPLALKDDKKKR